MAMRVTIETTQFAASQWLVREPLRGDWNASLLARTDNDTEPGDVVVGQTIEFESWRGEVVQAHKQGGLWRVVAVGCPRLHSFTRARQYSRPIDRAAILSDLCSDVGERASIERLGLVGQWRARGGTLAQELSRLSSTGAWYVDETGGVNARARPSRSEGPPGDFLGPDTFGARRYACDVPKPLAGATVDGIEVGSAVFVCNGSARPSVALVAPAPVRARALPTIGIGTASNLIDGRCDIALDNGEKLTRVPLFCAAGFAPEGANAVRVLVLDVSDDGANTIAITGVDGSIDALTLARAADAGPLLRAGDKVTISGLIAGANTVTPSAPGAVVINYDPTVTGYGPPGSGRSRVKG